MGVFTGTGLTNRADIIDTVMDRIITEVGTPPVGLGATITRDRDTGTVGSDNVEQWITIPADRMSSGKAMPYGMRPHPGAVNFLATNCSDDDFTTASNSDARDFDHFIGQPMDSATDDGNAGGQETDAPLSNGFNIATPYLRHWIITNPNFGALVSGNYGADERTYVYIVIEVDVNVYRTFGFCDVIQLGTWTTPASGFYIFGNMIQRNDNLGTETFQNGNVHMGSTQIVAQTPNANTPGGVVGVVTGDMNQNWLFQPDRDGVSREWTQSRIGLISDNVDTFTTSEFRNLGRDARISPAAYSGIALRIPIYLYSTRWTVAQVATAQGFLDTDTRWQLLAELPDAFFCNIRDLDPGTVFDDGTDRFLVLPTFEKGTTPSGNYGILLRNPAL